MIGQNGLSFLFLVLKQFVAQQYKVFLEKVYKV